jgi:hypothetical protein
MQDVLEKTQTLTRRVDHLGLFKVDCITYELKQYSPGSIITILLEGDKMKVLDDNNLIVPYRRATRESEWRVS